jgi:uncharacterized membrane protein YhaH (DUF805 family)
MNWSYLFLHFDGRISRKPYWIANVVLIAAAFLLFWISRQLDNDRIVEILNLALVYPDAAVMFKRAHDRGTPDWIVWANIILTVLLGAVSLLGLAGTAEDASTLYWLVAIPFLISTGYLLIELGVGKGMPGPNRYGPNPLQGSP